MLKLILPLKLVGTFESFLFARDVSIGSFKSISTQQPIGICGWDFDNEFQIFFAVERSSNRVVMARRHRLISVSVVLARSSYLISINMPPRYDNVLSFICRAVSSQFPSCPFQLNS